MDTSKLSPTEYSLGFLLIASLLSIYSNQAPHNTLLFFSLLVSSAYLVKNKNYFTLYLSQFKIFYFILTAYSIFYISTNVYHFGYTQDLLYAIQRIRWTLYFLIILPAFVIYLSANKNCLAKTLQLFYILLCIASAIIICDSLLRYFFNNNLLAKIAGSSHLSLSRPGWVYNPILFSKISFFTSIIFAIFYVNSKGKIKKYLSLCFALLTLMACLLTGVRGAWLGILILCLLTTLFIREFRIPGVLILFFTAVIFISFPENRMSKRVHTAITMSTQSEQYRLAHWKANLELALKHPLTGIGYGSNRKPGILSPYLKKGVRHGPSHNEYIDILSSSGFTGLLLFLGVLFSPFFYIFKLMLKSEKKIKQTLLILLSFQIFIFTTIIFDRLSSIGWTCLMYSWLPTFWLMFTKQLSFTSLNPRR